MTRDAFLLSDVTYQNENHKTGVPGGIEDDAALWRKQMSRLVGTGFCERDVQGMMSDSAMMRSRETNG
jgi:hypothetical protein